MSNPNDSATGFCLPSDERYVDPVIPGLTIRETFAMHALPAIIGTTSTEDIRHPGFTQWCAVVAVAMADALVAELERQP